MKGRHTDLLLTAPPAAEGQDENTRLLPRAELSCCSALVSGSKMLSVGDAWGTTPRIHTPSYRQEDGIVGPSSTRTLSKEVSRLTETHSSNKKGRVSVQTPHLFCFARTNDK